MIPTTNPLGGDGIHDNYTIRPTVFSKHDIPSFGKKRMDKSNPLSLDLRDTDIRVNLISLVKRNNNSSSAQHQEPFEASQSGALWGEKLCSINDTLVQQKVGRCSEAPKPPQRRKSLDGV